METCTAIQSQRKTQLIREYSRGAIDCSQYENFADDLNFVGLKTCTEIQSRRYDYLWAGYDDYPDLVTFFFKVGFDPITLNEVYCVDSFDSCE